MSEDPKERKSRVTRVNENTVTVVTEGNKKERRATITPVRSRKTGAVVRLIVRKG